MKINEVLEKMGKQKPPKTAEEFDEIVELLRENGINISNLYQELEMSSKYVNMHKDISFRRSQISLHSHSFYEVLFCRSCDRVEYLVGSRHYKLLPGDIIIIAPGIGHTPIMPPDMQFPYERDVLWVNPDFMKKISDLFPDSGLEMINRALVLRTRGTQWGYIGEYFTDGINESMNQKPGYDKIISAHAVLIISHVLRAAQDESGNVFQPEQPTLINSIIEYIEGHLDEKLSLGEVAEHFYISRGTLNKLFRESMDSTFYRFVTQRRLILAKVYIGEGESMERISEKCGFSDYSTFYKAFKKEYGISPREFAKL